MLGSGSHAVGRDFNDACDISSFFLSHYVHETYYLPEFWNEKIAQVHTRNELIGNCFCELFWMAA